MLTDRLGRLDLSAVDGVADAVRTGSTTPSTARAGSATPSTASDRTGRRLIPGGFVANDSVVRLRQNIQTVFLGHSSALDLLIIGLLGRGHVLIEDVPGVGKTVLAKSLAKSIACKFTLILLSPDLL